VDCSRTEHHDRFQKGPLLKSKAGFESASGAQARGEVAKNGDNLPRVTKKNSKPTADIGLTGKQIHEARAVFLFRNFGRLSTTWR
jgi:hypothetical protein